MLSEFTGGILFAGMTVALSKLLRAFWYGGGQENYYTKSLNPELPDKGYRLVPGGMQFPQGAESGIGNREVGAFLMNLWQISGRNQMFLSGNGSEGSGQYGDNISISDQKMYQQGQHFNKHGKDMGYTSKKAYEQGARNFIDTNKNRAEIFEGTWNSSRGIQGGEEQIIIRYEGKQAIINKETGQIIDFYEGTSLDGFIDIRQVQ